MIASSIPANLRGGSELSAHSGSAIRKKRDCQRAIIAVQSETHRHARALVSY